MESCQNNNPPRKLNKAKRQLYIKYEINITIDLYIKKTIDVLGCYIIERSMALSHSEHIFIITV